jgi:arginyl-tRNA synthetase
LDIDLDLLASHTNENPVYYVQYAHARTKNVQKKAAFAGVTLEKTPLLEIDFSALDDETENELISMLVEYERVVRSASEQLAPHKIARHLEKIAGAYHKWYAKQRVVPADDEELSNVNYARLALNNATGQVIKNALHLLGVSAPDRM